MSGEGAEKLQKASRALEATVSNHGVTGLSNRGITSGK